MVSICTHDVTLRHALHHVWCEPGVQQAVVDLYSLLVGVGSDVVEDVRHADLELVCDGRYPGVALRFEHLLHPHQVQVPCATHKPSGSVFACSVARQQLKVTLMSV